ncbi:hypothetical protein [Streptomyces sp. enrichment culture]|uniref:hypothetical protein n=1 Tax=Streptomyces sp. enrichment culture TaxID=1795815 RepID=UPI003F56479B
MTDYDIEHDQAVEVADFDAFFAEQRPEAERQGIPLRLYGRTYTLPASLPALFALQLHRVHTSARPDDIRRLLGSLFGPDAVDHWTERGMTDRQLGTVLLWATTNVAEPGAMSVEEAAAEYDRREAAKAAAGKATRPAPAKPRPKGKGKRRSSGARS